MTFECDQELDAAHQVSLFVRSYRQLSLITHKCKDAVIASKLMLVSLQLTDP